MSLTQSFNSLFKLSHVKLCSCFCFENCLNLNIVLLVLHCNSLENAKYRSTNTPAQITGVKLHLVREIQLEMKTHEFIFVVSASEFAVATAFWI